MNGIHDLGGIVGFGPVLAEENEPVFHEDWQRRVFAINLAALAFVGPIDRARHAIERMNALDYLTTGYYEHWLAGTLTLVREFGYATAEELETGRSVRKLELPHPAPTAEMIDGLVRGGAPASRDAADREPAFAVGDRVRARTFETAGHTRLARYVRGRTGVVTSYHGCHVFPDTNAHDRGENPQPLYSVRFEARELWGDNVTRRDCVQVDLWEDYLEAARGQ